MGTPRARFSQLAVLLAFAGALAGCDKMIISTISSKIGLDGTWVLQTINGVPVTSMHPGYPIGITGKYLAAGSLLLTTNEWSYEGQFGYATAGYVLRDAQGNAMPGDNYSGDYTWDGKSHVVLKAVGHSQDATVAGDVMTVTGFDPVLVQTVTLVFSR